MKEIAVPSYKQGREDYACGPACICMVLDYLFLEQGRPKLDHEAIRRVNELTMEGRVWSSAGTNYPRMMSAIRRMGFSYRVIQGRNIETKLESLRSATYRKHPVILGCMADIGRDRFRHYIVLTGIDERYLYIRDPYPGRRPRRLKIGDFTKNGKLMSWGNNRWGIEVYSQR